MISVRLKDVPPYLKNSAFYGSIDYSDEESFEVPENCFKPDTSIDSTNDLWHSQVFGVQVYRQLKFAAL